MISRPWSRDSSALEFILSISVNCISLKNNQGKNVFKVTTSQSLIRIHTYQRAMSVSQSVGCSVTPERNGRHPRPIQNQDHPRIVMGTFKLFLNEKLIIPIPRISHWTERGSAIRPTGPGWCVFNSKVDNLPVS